ncbi:MAG TPA: acetyl-CoA C-acyltransferase [Candidatus Binatia bacterium]|nr:acetyl-CoA C-acyltransferase [Candidatus Binatia bacterium]
MDAYIIDACRTPRGRKNGGLAGVHPVDLCTVPMKAIVERTGIDPTRIDDAIVGCVTEAGEQGACIGRAAVLAAGWPIEIAGFSLNRFCGSGQTAVNLAAQGAASGAYDVVYAGGVESMSRCPMGSDMGALPPSLTDRYNLIPQGLSAEMIADQWGYSRRRLDEYALESQRRAWRAIQEGRFAKSLVPVPDAPQADGTRKTVAADEHPRPQSTLEGLMALKPSFKPDGKIHAGNSSGIVDGAGGVLLASKRAAEDLGLTPRARIVDTVIVGSEPVIMLTGPIPATQKILRRTGMTVDDIDLVEINEAFAPVPLITMQEIGIPHEKVNVNGGAIALGHPLGATGAMLIGTLLDELERQDKAVGLCTMCIGYGMGIATIIERV